MLQSEIVQEDLRQVVTACGDKLKVLSDKTTLITGAGGFLPAYLVYALVHADAVHDLGLHLILLTRREIDPGSRLWALRNAPNVTFIAQDVSEPIVIDRPVHLIVHAASRAFPQSYLAYPLDTINANSLALRNLLELALVNPVHSVLFFSSSEVYGSAAHDYVPTPEHYIGCIDPVSERAAYAESKRFGETLCLAYYRQHQVPVKIVRPFHTYGPGLHQEDSRLIPAMIARVFRGEPLALLGDGRATRSYAYITDTVTASLLVLLSDENGEVFNIGTDSAEESVLGVVQRIAALVRPSTLVTTREDETANSLRGAPQRVCPDLTKLQTRLQYAPKVTLNDGLQRTIAWCAQYWEED